MFELNLDKLWKARKEYENKLDLEREERRAEDDRLTCEIHVNVNIWRNSLNEPTEIVEFVLSKYACHRWTWEEIESHLVMARWHKDKEGRVVDLNVAGIKLVSALKDITDTEKQVSWHEIVEEDNDSTER